MNLSIKIKKQEKIAKLRRYIHEVNVLVSVTHLFVSECLLVTPVYVSL